MAARNRSQAAILPRSTRSECQRRLGGRPVTPPPPPWPPLFPPPLPPPPLLPPPWPPGFGWHRAGIRHWPGLFGSVGGAVGAGGVESPRVSSPTFFRSGNLVFGMLAVATVLNFCQIGPGPVDPNIGLLLIFTAVLSPSLAPTHTAVASP